MKIIVFFFALLMLTACNSSRQSRGDYTKNKNRSKVEVASKSQKKSRKTTRASKTSHSTSDEEYLDPVSRASSTGAVDERASHTSAGTVKNVNQASIESLGNSLSADDNSSADHNANASGKNSKKVDSRNRMTSHLIVEADKMIGVKYRYGGTTPQRGFDCSGFTSYVFNKMKISIPRTSTDQSRLGKRKNFKDAAVGDLVFFGTGSRVTHVGIVVARTSKTMEVIHSTSSSGVRRDEIFGSTYWRSRTLWAIDFDSLKNYTP